MNHPSTFSFTLEKTVGRARVGYFDTPHGRVHTPVFMPVGTQASVKALDSRDVIESKSEIILANTYHLYLRPGTEVLNTFGGVQNFMKWQGPMLTDSGGFQVFSLGKQKEAKLELMETTSINEDRDLSQVKIGENGVEFASYVDGSKHLFTPESATEIQRHIGADIIMAFDECTPDQASPAYARQALDRTHRWAQQCVDYWESKNRLSHYGNYQALFGIIQGAMIPELRQESAKTIVGMDFDGIAVGGETIGYNMVGTAEVMEGIENLLPADKPRYAMGLGLNPTDIVTAIQLGFDMFDCVAPTRIARNGSLYVGQVEEVKGQPVFVSDQPKGRLTLDKSVFRHDDQVLQADCDCYTCTQGYSRAYLQHLYKTKELAYYRLASIHNMRFMVRVAEQVREVLLRS